MSKNKKYQIKEQADELVFRKNPPPEYSYVLPTDSPMNIIEFKALSKLMLRAAMGPPHINYQPLNMQKSLWSFECGEGNRVFLALCRKYDLHPKRINIDEDLLFRGPHTEPLDFERDLRNLLNTHSKENGSDTPDYILARYLLKCLENFDETVKLRANYYSRQSNPIPEPGEES